MTHLYSEQADLYDRAFGWDVSDEVNWLLARLGPDCRSVLEPGCGTGRYLETFAQQGVAAVGIDSEAEMVAAAQLRGTAVLADMRAFDLGRMFDGALCPIGTLALLVPEDADRHLICMGRHLRAGRRYLVQLAMRDRDDPESAVRRRRGSAPVSG